MGIGLIMLRRTFHSPTDKGSGPNATGGLGNKLVSAVLVEPPGSSDPSKTIVPTIDPKPQAEGSSGEPPRKPPVEKGSSGYMHDDEGENRGSNVPNGAPNVPLSTVATLPTVRDLISSTASHAHQIRNFTKLHDEMKLLASKYVETVNALNGEIIAFENSLPALLTDFQSETKKSPYPIPAKKRQINEEFQSAMEYAAELIQACKATHKTLEPKLEFISNSSAISPSDMESLSDAYNSYLKNYVRCTVLLEYMTKDLVADLGENAGPAAKTDALQYSDPKEVVTQRTKALYRRML
ncbi:MAG: hypothetical protein Q7T16_04380 [Candidatus Burarchaeum sp.]|nr:hypothetical protein [Candidatus Burarchaeum sp.]MDO8339866.1 hypothetical protein [Candidatus Burarchaeum sp.]